MLVTAARLFDAGIVGAPGPVERFSVHGDERRSLRLKLPGSARFHAPIPAGGVLAFGVVARPTDARIHLKLTVAAGGHARVAYQEDWLGVRPWSDRRVELAGEAGQEADLTLEASGGSGDAELAIAEPELLGKAPSRPAVIVYVVDCLRADRVGAYGNGRGLTPAIDALAKDGVVFEKAFACAGWTKPSVGCIFTGLWPPRHGARTVDDALDAGRGTLAEWFARAGYATAAWVANPELDGRAFGYDRGFDRYVELAQKSKGKAVNGVPADAAELSEGVLPWLEANRDRAFFLYLHSLDLHYPYLARPGFEALVRPERSGLERDSDLYDSELAYNDREIGRLTDVLRKTGLYERAVVVVTADHGEEFGAHGATRHGHTLFDDLLRVPLVVKPAGGSGPERRVRDAVANVDLAPTLLELARVPAAGLDGISLAPALAGKTVASRPLFAEQLSPAETIYAVRSGAKKYIHALLPEDREWLFDVGADPDESHDLLAADPGSAGALRALLLPFIQEGQRGYHLVLGDAPPGQAARLELSSEGRIERVVRLVVRTGDVLDVASDRRSATLTFASTGATRHVVVATDPPAAPLRIALSYGGKPLPLDAIAIGPEKRPPGALPVVLGAEQAAVPESPRVEDVAPAHAWLFFLGPRSAAPPMDEALREQMKALGYVQ